MGLIIRKKWKYTLSRVFLYLIFLIYKYYFKIDFDKIRLHIVNTIREH